MWTRDASRGARPSIIDGFDVLPSKPSSSMSTPVAVHLRGCVTSVSWCPVLGIMGVQAKLIDGMRKEVRKLPALTDELRRRLRDWHQDEGFPFRWRRSSPGVVLEWVETLALKPRELCESRSAVSRVRVFQLP